MKYTEEFWKKVRKEAFDWRWKKLNENFKDIEKPTGICEVIDYFVWGDQNPYQKQISNKKKEVLDLVNGKRKRKTIIKRG